MLDISPDRICLWFAFPDEIHDETLLKQYRSLLTKEEQRKEQRFHFEKDRHRHLVTRALVRTVLSRYAPLSPTQWVFAKNSHGKPSIANTDPLARRITFNISHTQGLIVLGVTCNGPLGVDIEHVRNRSALLETARSFFSKAESDKIALLPLELQQQRFFQYWTLKEAYVKARGMGMAIPLNQSSFHFSQQGKISMSLHDQTDDQHSRWRFWQFQPTKHHLVAICAERREGAYQQLTMRKLIPLGTEQEFDCTPVLESE